MFAVLAAGAAAFALWALVGAVLRWYYPVAPPASDPTGRPKRVAVIGAGASGLVFARELLQEGHQPCVFERADGIGGVFRTCYKGGQLTSSSVQTTFSSFSHGEESKPEMWPVPRFVQYLRDFATAHHLWPVIQFHTTVVSVVEAPRLPSGDRQWSVTTRSSDGTESVMLADAVAVCCGSHQAHKRPTFEGEDTFRGSILHSADYQDAAEFAGKRVLVVGCGESGSDIALQVAKVASASCLSTRKGPGYVIPRHYAGAVSDLDTNRAHHALPRWMGGTFILRIKVWLESLFLSHDDDARVLSIASKMNSDRGLPWQRRYGVKNTSFLQAMLYHDMKYCPQIAALRGPNTVEFVNGETFEADVILCATGYSIKFPFLPATLAAEAENVRSMYKHSYHPEHGSSLCFSGFTRPGVGAIPLISELQARFFSLLMSGKRTLPNQDDMLATIAADKNREHTLFHDDARIAALVDYQTIHTEFAGMVGCSPPLRRLFFTDVRLWAAVMFGPMNGWQYRLQGPGATYSASRDVLLKMPRMPAVVLAYEGLLLGVCKVLSVCGFSAFTPVGV